MILNEILKENAEKHPLDRAGFSSDGCHGCQAGKIEQDEDHHGKCRKRRHSRRSQRCAQRFGFLVAVHGVEHPHGAHHDLLGDKA